MNRDLGAEALSRGWSLSFDDLALVEALEPGARLGFAGTRDPLAACCRRGRGFRIRCPRILGGHLIEE